VVGRANDGHASGAAPARRRAATVMPQPSPPLAVAFAWEGGCLQDTANVGHELVLRTGAHWPPAGARLRGRMPLPGDSSARDAPYTADASQAIRLARGGRGGLAPRLDLRRGTGRSVSNRPSCSRNSSIALVASPSFSRRRPISQSRLSSGCCFIASWPASRNASRHAAIRAAGIPHARDSRSSASPRSRRNTTSVFLWADNCWGFFHPLVLPSPVALRAPCEGRSRRGNENTLFI
jgi:hypothetical protein